ncbi:hypothetical protein FRC01_006704 [Tulasnella sp. 417]|nr:hypothetical protein FRC01_006704 [Tulasnella sp. 417]
MTSGVDEFEAFVAALRLSFLTATSTAGSPEILHQGIDAFRETLRPRSPSTLTDASPTPSTEAYVQKSDHGHHSDEEPISSASTAWSCDDRIDTLTKQLELVSTEVREGTSGIRELTQSVKELKTEISDLRSALAASKVVTKKEVAPSPLKPVETATKASASSTLVHEAQVNSVTSGTSVPEGKHRKKNAKKRQKEKERKAIERARKAEMLGTGGQLG